jgi:hypothetical protein
MPARYAEGRYEGAENILHLWYPRPVHLNDEAIIHDFFEETEREWIRPCPTRPYLLVNYANVNMRADMAEFYARSMLRFRSLLLGTFRYGLDADSHGHFTAVAVHLGNMKLATPSNVFPSESLARQAIRDARARGASE